MKTSLTQVSSATTLRLFVVGAVVIIAMLCSLAVFGVQQDRMAREQIRESQCSYLQGALQTAKRRIATPLTGYSEVLTNYYETSEANYLEYLQQQIASNFCTA
jgi:hypothetical protein